MAIKIANKDSSIYDGSQEHSSFWLLQRAAYHHYHGSFIGKGHQSFDLKYDHECLHSYEDNSGALVLAKTLPPQFLLEANIAQSRLFDFVFRTEIFKYDIQLLNIDTVEQFETSLQKILSPKLFLNISARKPWDDNSLHSLIKIQALNIRFQSREGVLY